MLRISSPKDLLPFRPQEDLLPYEEGLRKAVCESKTASRTYRCATGALLDPSCCIPMTAFGPKRHLVQCKDMSKVEVKANSKANAKSMTARPALAEAHRAVRNVEIGHAPTDDQPA